MVFSALLCSCWPHTCLQVFGVWGFGFWNLNGLDGDHTIHLLPVGLFFDSYMLNCIFFEVCKTHFQTALWKLFEFHEQFLSSLALALALALTLTLFLSFSQAGSLQLSPIYVEITHGLEHILRLLQVNFITFFIFLLYCFIYFFNLPKFIQVWSAACDHFKKIQYADGITYGEIFLENK